MAAALAPAPEDVPAALPGRHGPTRPALPSPGADAEYPHSPPCRTPASRAWAAPGDLWAAHKPLGR